MLPAVREELHEFFNMTSLHGVKYIATRGNVAEKTLWVAVCGAALLGTLVVAGTIWTTFRNSPTQTIVEDPSFPVFNVDFPALTICNLNKVQHSRARRIMTKVLGKEVVDNVTEQLYMDSLLALSLMRYPYYHHPLLFVRRGNKKLMDFAGHNITDIMLNVMAKPNDIFGTCYWRGREIACDVAFRLQVTEEGFCYSFNSETSEIPNPPNLDSPPFQDRNGNKQPWRNNAAGKTTGLEVFFMSTEDEYLPSDERAPGYNLIVHHPSEVPDVSRGLFMPRSNQRVTVLAITASRVQASSAMERLSLAERGCRLPGDYVPSGEPEVQATCWSQCRLRAIANRCKCVPYFGVHRAPANTPQCTVDHISCLAAYNAQQRNIKPPTSNIKGFRKSDLSFAIECSCPPSCSSTTYKTELITANRVDPFPYDDYAYLDFFFKDLEIVSYVRDIKFGVMELIVSFGGMAGLFLGFSLISAVEMVYYTGRIVIHVVTAVRHSVRRAPPQIKTLPVVLRPVEARRAITVKKNKMLTKSAWSTVYPSFYP